MPVPTPDAMTAQPRAARPAQSTTSEAGTEAPGASFFRPGAAPPTPARKSTMSAGAPPVGAPDAAPAKRPATAAPTTAVARCDHPPRLAGRKPRLPAEVSAASCAPLDGLDPTALGVTYWFEAPPDGEPRAQSVLLKGRLVEPDEGRSKAPTAFEIVTTVHEVIPGSGWQCVTTRIPDVAPGRWDVTATPLAGSRPGSVQRTPVGRPGLARGLASGRTGFGMLVDALAPGVWAGSWSALVSLGFVLGLSLQAVLAGVLGLGWAPLTGVTLVAGALGLVGAKGYYLLTHPVERRRSIRVPGMSVQGFVIVALATLAVGALLLSVPVGAVLDATAPGLFLGMTVGRLGCLFAGCCVGRPTASRWGLWSSDRHVGVRRIPVQLMESSLCAALTALSAIAVGTSPVAGSGLVLVVGFAAYLVGRQLLFPLRAVGRVTRNGRMVTLVVASAVLATGLVVMWSA